MMREKTVPMLAGALTLLVGAAAAAHPELGLAIDSAAELELRTAVEIDPDDVRARVWFATVLQARGKTAEAEENFAKALALSPHDFDALDGLGWLRIGQGRFAEALALLRAARRVLEQDAMLHYHLGRAHAGLGANTEAEAAYRRALAALPARPQAEETDLVRQRTQVINEALRMLQQSAAGAQP